MILYAEDHPEDMEVLTEIISDLGKKVRIYTNLTDLKTQLELQTPSVILLYPNLGIPATKGLEALTLIRQDRHSKNLPVIIFAQASNHHYITESHELGANFFIVRPHSHKKLRTALRFAFKKDWSRERVSLENFLYQPGL